MTGIFLLMNRKRSAKFRITRREFWIALIFAVMGFVFSTRPFLLYMNQLNPLQGLVIYYIIVFITLYGLSKLGLTVFGLKISSVTQTLGLLMVAFAFFIVADWSSAWTNIAVYGNVQNVSTVYLQCEDGATYFVWSWLLPWADAEILRLLTYVFSPFVIALLGGLLVSKKIKLPM